MKNWRGKSGNGQISAMQRDIRKLQARPNEYLLVIFMNPSDQTVQNFDYLSDRLTGLQTGERQDYRFATEGLDGKAAEFWIAGWPVLKPTPLKM